MRSGGQKKTGDPGPSRWEEDMADDPVIRHNYASAKDRIRSSATLRRTCRRVEEDLQKGWVVKMSRQEALDRYGEDLPAGGPKDKDWSDARVVRDATHG